MYFYGKVIIINRNGLDGKHYPLTAKYCVFGRSLDCDIRVQLPTVDTSQCQILVDDKEHVFIQSTSTTSLTLVNDKPLTGALTALSHGDIITIVDRKFRFEFPVYSRFYPRKSPKPKSPRTPRRASMTELSTSGEKASSSPQHLIPVTPLSPRTDNVSASIKPPRSASKVLGQPEPGADVDQFSSPQTGRQLYGSAKKASSPEMLFNLSPNAFYRTSVTPGTSRDVSDPQDGRGKAGLDVSSNTPLGGQINQAFQKSPAPVRQKSPGSPYIKTPGNLRKSISDLRRRSVPVFETEEGSVQVEKKNQQHDFATPSVKLGYKRKSTAFDLLSAKSKRVSFGPNLSPEHFDKTLPPKTPIKKGATPSRIVKQERKSLLKAKSPGRKSKSPQIKSPARVVSTPTSSQVFEVSVNAETFSPTVTSADGAKLQSPKYGSVSPRSPRGGSENETVSLGLGSPGRKLSPANKRNSPASVKLSEKDSPIKEFSDQEMLLNNALTNSASALAILSPNTKLFGKDVSPLFTGNSSFASSQKSATPRSFSVSPAEKKRSVGRPRSKSSPSFENSPTSGRSDSSFQKSATPKSFSVSPSEKKRSVGRPRSKSSPSFELSPASGRSDYSFQKSATPKSVLVSPSEKKRSVGRPPSKSSPSLQSPATSRRSDSSFRKSVTPKKSHSPLETSISVRASLSPKNILLDTSDSVVLSTPVNRKYVKTPVTADTEFIEIQNTSAKSRKSTTSLILSQELFSQVSPNAVAEIVTLNEGHTSPKFKGTKLHNRVGVASPVGLKRIFRTPKHRQTANISPSAIKRLMKTPKVKHIQISPISPIGLRNLVKTPRNRKSNQVVDTPSGLMRLLKTPHVTQVSEASLSGVKETKKSPKSESADVSYSGVSTLFSTPDISVQSVASLSLNSGSTSVPKSAVRNTPRRYSQTPKKFLETPVTVYSAEKKRSVGRPPSDKKQPTVRPSSVERPVGRPPSEKRPVGLPLSEKRPVGRPSLGNKQPLEKPSSVDRLIGEPHSVNSPAWQRSSENSPVGHSPSEKRPVGRPSSEKRSVGRPPSEKRSVGRPPSEKRPVGRPSGKKMPSGAKNSPTEKIISPPQDFKKVVALRAIHGHGLTPKRASFKVLTPTSIRSKASSLFKKTPGKKTWSDIVKSGVQKPAPAKKTELTTIKAVTKRISPTLNKKLHKTPKTPRALARALAPTTGHADSPATIIVGRKFKGVLTPKLLPRKGRKESLSKASRKSMGNTSFTGLAEMFTEPIVSESSLYADIPDTPNGPNEMFVSPLSSRKSSLSTRKSTNLTGVRELFLKKPVQETNLIGVKELFISSKTESTVSPSGMKRLMKTPKKRASGVSPTGIKRLLTTRKIKGVPASPSGLDDLFRTPTLSGDAVPYGESSLNQAARSGKTDPLAKSTKSGQRGRKRKSEEPYATSSSKKKLTPLHLTADLSPKSSLNDHQELSVENKVASARKTSGKSPSSGKRQSEALKVQVAVENKGSPAVVSAVETSALVNMPVGLSDKQTLSPKSVRGRQGKAAAKTSAPVGEINIQSPPQVDRRGRRGQVEISESAVNVERVMLNDGDKHILSPPKVGPRGRRGKTAVKETAALFQSPPKVAARGRRGHAQIKESTVSVEMVKGAADNEHILSPPKVGPRGRQRKAQTTETASLSVDAQSPPKVGARGRKGQTAIKESEVNIKTVDDEQILSSPKVGPRGRQRKAQTTETVSQSVNSQSPPKVGARGRRGQAGIKGSEVNVEAVAVGDRHILSPPKVGPQGKRRKAQITETVSLAADVQSPPKVGVRGRRGRAEIKASTDTITEITLALNEDSTSSSARSSGHRQGRQQSKEKLQVQENATLVESAEPLSKGKRGRGHTKEPAPVHSVSSLNADGETAGSKVRQSRTAVIKSVSGKDEAVAVIEKTLSPAATRGGRGRSKIKSEAEEAPTVTLDVKATSSSKTATSGRHVEVSLFQYNETENKPSTKTTTNRRKVEAQIVNTLDNTSTVATSGNKRGKKGTLEVVPQITEVATTNSPKGRGGRRRNETLPVTESALPEKSSARRAGISVAPVTSVSSSAGTPEGKQMGGMKRKAGTSTAVSAKKVKLDSPVPVSPVKPKATRRGQHAEAKILNINTVAFPKGRGRPKKGAVIMEVASPLINAASVIPVATPKAGKGQLKATAVSSPRGRGRPKKAADVSVIPESSPKGRKGQLKKAETVLKVASPSAGKRGRPNKDVSVQDGTTLIPKSSPAKGRQGKLKKASAVVTIVSPALKKRGGPKASLVVANKSKRNTKSAGAIYDAAAVLPKSPVATRRRRL